MNHVCMAAPAIRMDIAALKMSSIEMKAASMHSDPLPSTLDACRLPINKLYAIGVLLVTTWQMPWLWGKHMSRS